MSDQQDRPEDELAAALRPHVRSYNVFPEREPTEVRGEYERVHAVAILEALAARGYALSASPLAGPGQPAPDAGLRAALKAISDRYDDLRWCGKDDDCHIKAEGAALALSDFDAALAALPQPLAGPQETHKPGDFHRYRLECEVCGQRGQIQVSMEPQLVPVEAEP